MSSTSRIDVHQHPLPPEFVAALERRGLGAWAPVGWSAEGAIAAMDQHEIATGVLSLSTPGTHMGDDAEARSLTREINERLANLKATRPDRFGMFASVPLPNIDDSLEAIREAYDDLATDGVVLIASNKGVYLGDPVYEPVMAELNRRNAIVFIHPTALAGAPVPGLHPVLADLLLDTTRAAINLALKGVIRRYPNLKFILSHGGGFLPYAGYRAANLANIVYPEEHQLEDVLEDLSSFYFDTALASSPSSMPSLLKFTKPGHILYGSDWPYCLDKSVSFFTAHLDEYDGLDEAGHAAINRGNAEALLPRLAKR